MRFECDSCHAKYKISDDKVRGRVVRFPCRKCDHRILIDGRNVADVTVPAAAAYGFDEVTRTSGPAFGPDAPTARARRPSSPGRRRPPSAPPPRRPVAASRRLSSAPAAASAALAGQHPGLAPPVPAAVAAVPAPNAREIPQWHVSINDVPIGPIRLEEMAHKVDAGAVSEYSLVWREGLDEWRPLATVPELMGLLHHRRNSGPPARSSFSSMPPFVESRTSIAEASAAPRPVFGHGVPPELPGQFAPLADSLQPEEGLPGVLREMSQPPAPIGPSEVFEASHPVGTFSGLPSASEERVSVPSIPPQTATAIAATEPRSGLSVGALALILSLVVFSAVFAFLVFERYGDALMANLLGDPNPAGVGAPAPQLAPQPAAAAPVEETDGTPVEAEPGPAGNDATDPEGDATSTVEVEAAADASANDSTEATLKVEPPNPADDGPKMAPAPPRKPRLRRARSQSAESTASGDSLSAADQKLLDDFGSSADTAPAKIDVAAASDAKSKNPPLDGDAVRATVTTNKPRLQRCYERAIRGQQSPPSVRMDVTVTVAASGRVKNASAVGSGPGGLAECIEASVRRWRFPSSSEGGPAKFPIVFSAN